MKAPDKIKIGKYNITSDGDVVFGWVTNEPDCEAMQHDIEYTRTDAFIEKACEWLKNSTYGYLTEKWGEIELDRETLSVDFAKYMKGE